MYRETLISASKVIHALKSTGVIVQVKRDVFLAILEKTETPIIVTALKKSFMARSSY